MTGKSFIKAVANGETDVIEILLRLLLETGSSYCVIGGLAVNAFAEPVVSLDLDVIVVSDRVGDLTRAAAAKGMKMHTFEHSINLSIGGSDLRIQIQTAARYQPFVSRAERKNVLGYEMFVACLEDVVQGKVWAYSDETRRGSKRQKDLSDIMRLVETHPFIREKLPVEIRSKIE